MPHTGASGKRFPAYCARRACALHSNFSRHRRRFEGRSSSLCQQQQAYYPPAGAYPPQQAYPQAAAYPPAEVYPRQPGLTPMMPTVVPTVVATHVGGTQGKYCGPISWVIGIVLFFFFGPFAFFTVCCPCDERPVDQH